MPALGLQPCLCQVPPAHRFQKPFFWFLQPASVYGHFLSSQGAEPELSLCKELGFHPVHVVLEQSRKEVAPKATMDLWELLTLAWPASKMPPPTLCKQPGKETEQGQLENGARHLPHGQRFSSCPQLRAAWPRARHRRS